MKVALATWNGRISPVFDVARQILMLDVEKGCVCARREEMLPGTEPLAQVSVLRALGPQVLICGAISRPMADLLAATKVRVLSFTAGGVEDVLAAWLAGNLPNPDLSMPGCCGRMRRCHGGNARRRGRRAGAKGTDSLAKAQRSPSIAKSASLRS